MQGRINLAATKNFGAGKASKARPTSPPGIHRMDVKVNNQFILSLGILLIFAMGCRLVGEGAAPSRTEGPVPKSTGTLIPASATADSPPAEDPAPTQPSGDPTQIGPAAEAVTSTPTATEFVFEVGREITIRYLRGLEIEGSEITFEEERARPSTTAGTWSATSRKGTGFTAC